MSSCLLFLSLCMHVCVAILAQIFVAIIMAVLPTVRGHHRGIMRIVWSAQGGSESSFACLPGSTQVTRLELDHACHPPTPPRPDLIFFWSNCQNSGMGPTTEALVGH